MIDRDELIIAKTEWSPLNRALTGKGREVQSLKNQLNVEADIMFEAAVTDTMPDVINDYFSEE